MKRCLGKNIGNVNIHLHSALTSKISTSSISCEKREVNVELSAYFVVPVAFLVFRAFSVWTGRGVVKANTE